MQKMLCYDREQYEKHICASAMLGYETGHRNLQSKFKVL